jgi:NhaP-type Na+/H+ or K+/H+ antiporter
MHISGESLLNDGSAYVFFNIFRARFLYQLNIPDVGKNIGWGEGFKIFFQLSLGGMCIGIAFGLGTVLVLYKLKHRLSGEDVRSSTSLCHSPS